MEKITHHINEYPNSIPDKEHKVTVPGPINAEVIIKPGPIFFIFFTLRFMLDFFVRYFKNICQL